MGDEISARQGEHVEIRLPATSRWSLNVQDADGILGPVEPQGVAGAEPGMLEWRYLAVKPGSATLTFSGRAIPQPGRMTPHFVLARTFTVTVTA